MLWSSQLRAHLSVMPPSRSLISVACSVQHDSGVVHTLQISRLRVGPIAFSTLRGIATCWFDPSAGLQSRMPFRNSIWTSQGGSSCETYTHSLASPGYPPRLTLCSITGFPIVWFCSRCCLRTSHLSRRSDQLYTQVAIFDDSQCHKELSR